MFYFSLLSNYRHKVNTFSVYIKEETFVREEFHKFLELFEVHRFDNLNNANVATIHFQLNHLKT